MKNCIKCHTGKSLDQFYRGKNTCKPCFITQMNARHMSNRDANLAYKKAHYQNNKQTYANHELKRRATNVAWMDELKSKPCEICCGVFPPECMDFDHLEPQTKKFTISGAWSRHSRADILAEIAVCRLICANCHRIHTAKQRGRGLQRTKIKAVQTRRSSTSKRP